MNEPIWWLMDCDLPNLNWARMRTFPNGSADVLLLPRMSVRTWGAEIKKTRPCVIVSPDELNADLRSAIVAPLTSAGKPFPFRVPCKFKNTAGLIVLDQLRTVDGACIAEEFGILDEARGRRGLGATIRGSSLQDGGTIVTSAGLCTS